MKKQISSLLALISAFILLILPTSCGQNTLEKRINNKIHESWPKVITTVERSECDTQIFKEKTNKLLNAGVLGKGVATSQVSSRRYNTLYVKPPATNFVIDQKGETLVGLNYSLELTYVNVEAKLIGVVNVVPTNETRGKVHVEYSILKRSPFAKALLSPEITIISFTTEYFLQGDIIGGLKFTGSVMTDFDWDKANSENAEASYKEPDFESFTGEWLSEGMEANLHLVIDKSGNGSAKAIGYENQVFNQFKLNFIGFHRGMIWFNTVDWGKVYGWIENGDLKIAFGSCDECTSIFVKKKK